MWMQTCNAFVHNDLRMGEGPLGGCVEFHAQVVVGEMIVRMRRVQVPNLG